MKDERSPAVEDDGGVVVTLSLVSHTNVGKTTLARTLLRRDVGEVLDQAHVTEENEMFVLLETEGAQLRLWDTPGFGDSARLLSRLSSHDRPIVWFVQQLWDRVTDRPFWCGQQAVLNVQKEADLVLYLVNAVESPREAGYVEPEMNLLAWMDRPILVLLNQTGEETSSRTELEARREEWVLQLERWPMVHDVLPLDAFCRSWVQEDALMETIARALSGPKAEAMKELAGAWHRRNRDVFERSVREVAVYLARAAEDREATPSRRPGKDERRRSFEALSGRLEASTRDLTTSLLALHGLEGEEAASLERALDAIVLRDRELLDEEKSALWGGILSGAAGGLAADLLAGGLTFGGGALAGAILGALGGAGLARGARLVRGDKRPAVAWSPEFLEQLTRTALVRYLAIASFGRGRGEFRGQEPERWRVQVEEALRSRAEDWRHVWAEDAEDRERRLRRLVEETVGGVLRG